MKILVVDNYDSFVYNLVHILRNCKGVTVDVYKNDCIDLEAVDAYDKILLSPGPGLPKDAGIMPQLIERYAPTKSILGVCLGHQAIGEYFGAELYNLPEPLHGIASKIQIDTEDYLFQSLNQKIQIGHYHSWVVTMKDKENDVLEIIAKDKNGNTMALRHKTYDVRGVQFHPESILTASGITMIKNWVYKN